MKKNVHVVPHSHWDREWYFTTSRSKVYLMHNLRRILDILKENNNFTYTLDGQASLLDDYLAWKPNDKDLIIDLVKRKKLIIGPWYTQTDQMVISGESIVRNLLYGINISREFGGYMNIGYVPDSFGQSAAMPQIYKKFGIEDTLFWRGVSDDDVNHSEFKWRGEDGTTINAFQIQAGYYIGGDIPEDEEKLKEYLHKEPFKTIWDNSTTNEVLFPNGFDQAPVRENLQDLIERMQSLYEGEFDFRISTLTDYVEEIKKKKPNLEEISGELLNGKLMRVHKSIFSSRSDLKKLNTEIQNYLVNVLEPLLSLSKSLGFDYPVEVTKEIWKLMFENASHDSIGSCVSDTTNEDIYFRYKKARDLAKNVVELKMREIVMHIKNQQEITLTAFNLSGKPKKEIVKTELYVPQLDFSIKDQEGNLYNYTILDYEDQTEYILGQGNVLDSQKEIYKPIKVYKVQALIELKNMTSFGYKQLYIDLTESSHDTIKQCYKDKIENDYYDIALNDNNTLDILDKKTGKLYKNQAIIEENGDDGDSFNYSPPRNDLIVESSSVTPEISVKASGLTQIMQLKYEMLVPKNLEEREKKIRSTRLPITMEIILKKGSPIIEFSLKVDNRFVDSHRVCVLFNSEIASKFSKADHQFGSIRRPVFREREMSLWKKDPSKWNEVPIAIEPCQSYVTLDNDERGVSVIPKGVREYEIVGESFDTIRLTIFRTYGQMGKENLLYRPGRASGETVLKTIDAQCHKIMKYEFSVVYYRGDMNSYKLSNIVSDYLKNIQVYQNADYLNTRLRFTQFDVKRNLPLEYNFMTLSGDNVFSLIKKAENKPGYIIRFYNGHYHQNSQCSIIFNKNIDYCELEDLKEEKIQSIYPNKNKVTLPELKHNQIITLYVEV